MLEEETNVVGNVVLRALVDPPRRPVTPGVVKRADDRFVHTRMNKYRDLLVIYLREPLECVVVEGRPEVLHTSGRSIKVQTAVPPDQAETRTLVPVAHHGLVRRAVELERRHSIQRIVLVLELLPGDGVAHRKPAPACIVPG